MLILLLLNPLEWLFFSFPQFSVMVFNCNLNISGFSKQNTVFKLKITVMDSDSERKKVWPLIFQFACFILFLNLSLVRLDQLYVFAVHIWMKCLLIFFFNTHRNIVINLIWIWFVSHCFYYTCIYLSISWCRIILVLCTPTVAATSSTCLQTLPIYYPIWLLTLCFLFQKQAMLLLNYPQNCAL